MQLVVQVKHSADAVSPSVAALCTKFHKNAQDAHHGKAWGIFTWKGADKNEAPTRVRGTLKKVWRLFEDPSPKVEWKRVAPSDKPAAGAETPSAEHAQSA